MSGPREDGQGRYSGGNAAADAAADDGEDVDDAFGNEDVVKVEEEVVDSAFGWVIVLGGFLVQLVNGRLNQ